MRISPKGESTDRLFADCPTDEAERRFVAWALSFRSRIASSDSADPSASSPSRKTATQVIKLPPARKQTA
jgi:hypothetical protein